MKRLERAESLLTVALLIVLLGFSVVSAVVDIDTAWLAPALLLALLLILRIVWPLGLLRDDVVNLQRTVGRLAADSEFARVRVYRSADDFYGELERHVRAASDRIVLTYLRRTAPKDVGDAAETNYFDAVIDWARDDESHTVRRIVGRLPGDGEPSAWLREQVRLTSEIGGYSIRLVDWPLEADAINMAIIDEEFAFLLIAGDHPGKLRGLSVKSADVARYLTDYHTGLWEHAEPCVAL